MNPFNFSERANASLVEDCYQRWLSAPDSVDPTWRAFFQGFVLGSDGKQLNGDTASGPAVDSVKQAGIYYLLSAYRSIGHGQAHINPLDPNRPATLARLSLEAFKLSDADLDTGSDTDAAESAIPDQ